MADAPLTQLRAPAHWRRIAIASDVHLSADAPHTARAWHGALADCDADALILLGDYFDVWVGDDALDADPSSTETPEDAAALRFWQDAVAQLAQASARMAVYWLVGNRDFLSAERFALATGVQRCNDPLPLDWRGQRSLLSHGDAWCTDDADYMAFRAQVRGAEWQAQFLGQALGTRLQQARLMRANSQAHQQAMAAPSDVNDAAVEAARVQAQASQVIHGHTHQGQSHVMPSGHARHVTLDWCVKGASRRAEWLCLTADGVQRVAA
jgi:UDP-2,3-diacylglucosamine hydrolase